ncbi:MAG TPA: YihY/virulence factor BrkB family protein [Nocardioidaceae bacterium]|nr:YihY/virulence factor BrkB family protein [Nocardioidaceae bacterium]
MVYKFFDDQGNHLAALITYFAFLSTFPLLLLGTSILGFVLQGSPQLESTILDSALGQFPIIGDQLSAPSGLPGSGLALVIGAIGVLYGALGIAVQAQNALNVAWAVPRNHRPNPLMLRVRGLGLLCVAAVALLATAVLTALAADVDVLGMTFGGWPLWAVRATTLVFTAGFLTLLFWMSTTDAHRLRDDVAGAVLAALLWQGMQILGVRFIDQVVRGSSVATGVFAVVLGLLVWMYAGAILTVLCIEVNVVRARRLYPRALLAPFTDDVDLTDADMRAYTSYANAQRTKDFATVRVRFDHDGQHATAQREQD